MGLIFILKEVSVELFLKRFNRNVCLVENKGKAFRKRDQHMQRQSPVRELVIFCKVQLSVYWRWKAIRPERRRRRPERRLRWALSLMPRS